jgi:hypothetical protein
MTTSNPKDRLERLIDRTLREQPPRHAPSSLEHRVLAELARRAELPWWRRSFAYWPLAVRAAFIVAAIGVAKVGVEAAMWAVSGLRASPVAGALESEMSWVQSLGNALNFLLSMWTLLLDSIPAPWLYGGILLVAMLYVSMFALSAVAYRTLYAAR